MKERKGSLEASLIAILVLSIVGFFVLMMGFDYVPAGNVGVTNRLGVVGDIPWGPGIKWTGILTGTEKFTTRIQLREYDATAASRDLQIVRTKIALNFKLNPSYTPEIFRTLGKEYQDTIISPIIQESVKSVTAKYTAENLIKERTSVKNDMEFYIMSKLESKGLVVTEVSITDFEFSPEFNAAIEEKQVAEQKALTAENRYNEMTWTSQAMKLQTEVLEIKRLDLQEKWIAKWSGNLPTFMCGESPGMLMNINLGDSQ